MNRLDNAFVPTPILVLITARSFDYAYKSTFPYIVAGIKLQHNHRGGIAARLSVSYNTRISEASIFACKNILMELFNLLPDDPLNACIKHIAFIEVEAQRNSQKTFAPVVDGCPGIIIQDTASGTLHRENKQLPAAFLFGQSTGYAELYLHGSLKAICIFLQPHAVASLFKMNANELTDSCLDVSELPKGQLLLNMLNDKQVINDKVNVLKNYLGARLDGSAHFDASKINYILDKLISSNGGYPLSKLRAEVNISERSFERKFKYHVGISPRLFSRICKFHASFQHLNSKRFSTLTEVAFENEYADQSHLIRAFKEFAGSPPLQLQRKLKMTTENLCELLV